MAVLLRSLACGATAEDNGKDIDMASNARMWSELFGGNSLVDGRSNTEAVMDAVKPGAGLLNMEGPTRGSAEAGVPVMGGLLSAPVSPYEQAKQNHGDGFGFFMKSMLVAKNPALAGWLMPELSASNLAQYKSDMELYNKYREMSLVDPQDQAVADLIDDPLKKALVLAGGIKEMDLNNKVLSPGQRFISGLNQEVLASGGPVDNRTTDQRNADAIAENLGVDLSTQGGKNAYADIMAAVAEPTITTTLPDGSVRTSNSIDAVYDRFRSGAYGNQQAQGSATSPSGGSTSTGNQNQGPAVPRSYQVTPEEAQQASLDQAVTDQLAKEAAAAEVALKDYDKIMGSLNSMGEWKETTDADGSEVRKFVPGNGLEWILGSMQGTEPFKAVSTFFSQDAADAEANLNNLLAMLTVNERQRLVGQGQITEGEQKMLAEGVSLLTQTTISEEEAARAFELIGTAMGDSKVRAEGILGKADPDNKLQVRHRSGEGVSFGGKVYHNESDFLKDAKKNGADIAKAQKKWRELNGG